MTKRAAGNKGKHGDFSRLFRDVQAGRKPIDALIEDPTFKKYLQAIVAAAKKPERAEDLATEEVHDALLSLRRFDPDHLHFRDVFPSVQRFESDYLLDLESEFDDLLANMQTARSKRAVQKAFKASPSQLGRAAVKHARKNR